MLPFFLFLLLLLLLLRERERKKRNGTPPPSPCGKRREEEGSLDCSNGARRRRESEFAWEKSRSPCVQRIPVKKREKNPHFFMLLRPQKGKGGEVGGLIFLSFLLFVAPYYTHRKKGVSPSLGAGFDVYLCFFSLKATIVYFRKTNGVFLFFIRPSLSEKRKKCLPFPFLPLFYFGFVCTHLPLPFPLYERRKRRKKNLAAKRKRRRNGLKTTLNTNRLRSATSLFALQEEERKIQKWAVKARERGNKKHNYIH